MTMMAMPATAPRAGPNRRAITPPIALALAPSATNTVEKPSTNRMAATMVSGRTRGSGLGIGEPLERGAGQINEIRRHQRQHAGRQKTQHSGDSAATMVTFGMADQCTGRSGDCKAASASLRAN